MDPAVTLNNILQKYDDPEKYEHTPPLHEWWYNNDYVCSPPRPKIFWFASPLDYYEKWQKKQCKTQESLAEKKEFFIRQKIGDNLFIAFVFIIQRWFDMIRHHKMDNDNRVNITRLLRDDHAYLEKISLSGAKHFFAWSHV